ncbi:UNVERIFIED_CONTAM: hypothetical protein FKN15_060750 [Acipenser sinensis]
MKRLKTTALEIEFEPCDTGNLLSGSSQKSCEAVVCVLKQICLLMEFTSQHRYYETLCVPVWIFFRTAALSGVCWVGIKEKGFRLSQWQCQYSKSG